MRRSRGESVFQVFAYAFLLLILASIILPILNLLSVSLSGGESVRLNRVSIYPIGFTLESYYQLVRNNLFGSSVFNTVLITVCGTVAHMLMTVLSSYALSTDFFGKKIFTYYFVVTMYFGGGLIPTYVVYTQILHLRDTYWVLILPGLISMGHIIVMRSQITTIPSSIFEAADIDGAKETHKLFLITLPAIMPTIAALSMFTALEFWNSWFGVMIYMTKTDKWTLQYFLRSVIFDKMIQANNSQTVEIASNEIIQPVSFQAAAIVLVALPIVAIYPFVQKYFAKGILTGAVKG